jgi:acetoin utilization deacetylase AcuC-like enzyme
LEFGYDRPMTIRVFTDQRCLLHRSPPGYPEQAERLEATVDHLAREGHDIVDSVAFPEVEERIRLLHEPAYVERLRHAVERGDGLIDSADNPLSEGTLEASLAAVETVLTAADWVIGGADRKALAAVRPPGHHAEKGTAMGFCYFNNAAIAAGHLLDRHGLSRVAIFDFDVHHGNGTQHLFEERSDVLYVSTHQFPFYPGTGAADERGRGAGEGATVNVPLPAGTGDEGYSVALEEKVLPALEAFSPEVLMLSAGFDAWRRDPVGGMQVTEEGYHDWSTRLADLAGGVCEGRILSVLEGGYDLTALPSLVDIHLRGLNDRKRG